MTSVFFDDKTSAHRRPGVPLYASELSHLKDVTSVVFGRLSGVKSPRGFCRALQVACFVDAPVRDSCNQ
jgi:hypothetical protein